VNAWTRQRQRLKAVAPIILTPIRSIEPHPALDPCSLCCAVVAVAVLGDSLKGLLLWPDPVEVCALTALQIDSHGL
jgi:hypothetical protein